MAITTEDGRWMWVNHALAGMLGYTPAELVGRTFTEMTHPDDVPRSVELWHAALAGTIDRPRLEKRLLHKRGHPLWVVVDGAMISDPALERRYILAQFRNETERHIPVPIRAGESHEHWRATNAPGVIYQYAYRPDGSRGFTFVSDGMRSLFGVTVEELLANPAALFDLVHPDDRAGMYASGMAAVAELRPWYWEGRVVLRTGEVRYIRAASNNTRQPDGTILADGLLMDATEARQTAARLDASEQRYHSLFAHHPDAVFSLDIHGAFTSANPACEATSGYRPEELIGTSFAPLMAPEDLETATRHFRAAAAGTAQTFEVAIIHKSGRRVVIDVANIPIIVDGEVVGVFGIAKDVTVRHALEEQLRQAQKMEAVGQLAGGVAHDFNNILATITGFAELLQHGLDEGDQRRSDVEEILKATRRAAGLTRQLLAFSRKQVLQPVTLDLNQLVTETAAMLRPLLGATLNIVTAPSPTPVSVVADRTQLEQVLLNLALNARDAMPDGGTLTMTVSTAASPRGAAPMAVIAVRDTGVGMPPDVMARVFEPFFTTKPVGKGTGLGLATVHGIVQQSGGSVQVESQPGAGATFTVLLPLAAAEPPAAEAAHTADTERGAGTVLLVEDEAPLRTVAKRVLERAGYRVLTAEHGQDALRVLAEAREPIDVLLSDVTMPELSGIELAAIASEHMPGIRVVLMSGFADAELGAVGAKHHVHAFVAKPFAVTALLDAVRGVMQRDPA
jgi:PAS domain S-box-containing protein